MTPKTSQTPIFILSAERSGSTLLRYLLDSHPDIGSPGEIWLGRLCDWLLMGLPRLRPTGDVAEHVDVEGAVVAEARRVIDEIMSAYLERTRKRIWCDKTPANLKYLPSLARVFPDARYLCLYRSCLDTVYSCIEASRFGIMHELQEYVMQRPGNLVQAMIESWVDKNTRLALFEAERPKDTHRLRYEDLVRDPERELMRACRFLHLKWDAGMITNALRIPHFQGGGDGKILGENTIHQRSLGGGKSIPAGWLNSVSVPVIGRTNQLLKHLGYEPIFATKQS